MNPAPWSFTPGETQSLICAQRPSAAQVGADAQIGVDDAAALEELNLRLAIAVRQWLFTRDLEQPAGLPRPLVPTVIEMRTAAASVASTQGWLGIA